MFVPGGPRVRRQGMSMMFVFTVVGAVLVGGIIGWVYAFNSGPPVRPFESRPHQFGVSLQTPAETVHSGVEEPFESTTRLGQRSYLQHGPPPAPSCPAVPKGLLGASSGSSPGSKTIESQGPALRSPANDELYRPILPSLFKEVNGIEPFEQEGMSLWQLHTVPGNDWVQRASSILDRCDHMDQENGWPNEQPKAGTTWVASLLDLKRGDDGSGMFKRTMSEYFARFQRVLDRKFPMVLFIPEEYKSKVRLDPSLHFVVPFTTEDLRRVFPYLERLTKIRTSNLWVKQGKALTWLYESPQSQLELYDPLVMSKVHMLREAARLNPFDTRYFMWMDAGHACAGATNPGQIPVWEDLMETNRFLITHWPYGSTTEVHGMLDKAMHLYVGTAQDPLRIVRGGVLGGRRAAIECFAKVYAVVLRQTLADGYLGTEENILAISFARFPHLFAPFDNGDGGDNCASFTANTRLAKSRAK